MIIYSVTISLEDSVFQDWKFWMQNQHIPQVLKTGYFSGYKMSLLVEPPPETGTVTINIQYTCRSLAELKKYQEIEAPALQADHNQRYKDKFVAFRTILEEIE
jgi:hypothetical protein